MQTDFQKYHTTLKKLADVEHAMAVLSWDKEVNAPGGGAELRAQQIATLSGIAHDIFTNAAFGDLLQQLNESELSDFERRNIVRTLHDYQRAQSFSQDFVIRRSRAVSAAYDAWLKAREANDYQVFREALANLIEIKREEASLVGYDDHPYDALLDEYEPSMRVAQLDVLFSDVRRQLVDFVRELRQRPQVADNFLRQHFAKDDQWNFGLHLLENMGYRFENGRQDISPHPFTTSFGASDVRVTTRIDEKNFGSMTWSCIHEGGHALYEQGLPVEYYGLPAGKYLSLGIHESQSRLWENNVGRSLPYWEAHYSNLQTRFPKQLGAIDVKMFYKGINRISPSLIRVESDELHYHFHILIRYEIEKALLEGKVEAAELEDYWNSKYKEYLDVDVPDAKQGILQDIHWSYGSLGYFPTYSLGSFYAAQFFQQAQKDIPELRQQIQQGDNSALLAWLREKVHRHGQLHSADDLCTQITGEPLNFRYFMDYAREKYQGIYGR